MSKASVEEHPQTARPKAPRASKPCPSPTSNTSALAAAASSRRSAAPSLSRIEKFEVWGWGVQSHSTLPQADKLPDLCKWNQVFERVLLSFHVRGEGTVFPTKWKKVVFPGPSVSFHAWRVALQGPQTSMGCLIGGPARVLMTRVLIATGQSCAYQGIYV